MEIIYCQAETELLWLIIPALVLIAYYLLFYSALLRQLELPTASADQSAHLLQPASIIIAARNEQFNLEKNLPEILAQDYPEFEVIIVDDGSEDSSPTLLKAYEDKKLKFFRMSQSRGKKKAILRGIEEAKYAHLVFIDADCTPASRQWLKGMMEQFTASVEIVLGHGRYAAEPTFLNRLIRHECLSTATQYLSFAQKGKPYMGVGRNLAYTKKVFSASTAFDRYDDLLSGDDDLLVNEMANASNVAISAGREAHTISETESSWKAYFHQRRRQLQAGTHYRSKDQLALALLGSAHLVFNISTLILLWSSGCKLLILTIFALKGLIQTFYLKKMSNFLGDKDVSLTAAGMDLIYYPLISLLAVSTQIWKIKKWK